MQYFVRTLTGKSITVDIEWGETTLDLKQKIFEKEGIPVAEQRLIFCGMQLPNHKLLDLDKLNKHAGLTLVRRLPLDDQMAQRFLQDNDLREPRFKMMWAVQYLDQKDDAFTDETFQFPAVSSNLDEAHAAFLKRSSQQAEGRQTYLSLIALPANTDGGSWFEDDAAAKFQSPQGGMKSYTYLGERAGRYLPLLVAIPDGEGSFRYIQSPNANITASPRYKAAFGELARKMHSVPSSAAGAVSAADGSAAAASAPAVVASPRPSASELAAFTSAIEDEIEFNEPTSEAEITAFSASLKRLKHQLGSVTKLPIPSAPPAGTPTIDQLIITHLNDCRRLVASSVPDSAVIQHVIELIDAALPAETLDASASAARVPSDKGPALMFDHGGVLDGEMIIEEPGDNDIVISDLGGGLKQVLKNGFTIIEKLNELVEQHRYRIAFHSANSHDDQMRIWNTIKSQCEQKGIRVPVISAMAVYDEENQPEVDAGSPIISTNEDGITVATFGKASADGKASIRQALCQALDIPTADHAHHHVFDDGTSVIPVAKGEGYQVHLIDESHSLLNEVDTVLRSAQESRLSDDNSQSSAASAAAGAGEQAWDKLSDGQRAEISLSTRNARVKLQETIGQRPTASDYYNLYMDESQRQALLAEIAARRTGVAGYGSFHAPAASASVNDGTQADKFEQLSPEFQAYLEEALSDQKRELGLLTSIVWQVIGEGQQDIHRAAFKSQSSPRP